MAAARRDVRDRRRRHTIAFALYALAAVIAIGHFFEHAGTLNLMALSLEDIFIGWPMAGVLAVTGAIVYGT